MYTVAARDVRTLEQELFFFFFFAFFISGELLNLSITTNYVQIQCVYYEKYNIIAG